jgi:hypothetical protein
MRGELRSVLRSLSIPVVAAASGFSSSDVEVFVCIRAKDVLVVKTAEPVAAGARNRLPGTVEIPLCTKDHCGA